MLLQKNWNEVFTGKPSRFSNTEKLSVILTFNKIRCKNMKQGYTDKTQIKASKFLSLVLRHKPETIGISLDQEGWVSVDELLAAARRAKKPIDKNLLLTVVKNNDKQRFALSEDQKKIRANQGHSVSVDLGLEPKIPPETLYHGTASRFLESIRQKGLVPQNRNHVHISKDEATAVKVGKRHGKPVVLIIQAKHMHDLGFEFYISENGVWLTSKVPPEYIVFPHSVYDGFK